jgi:hypothetical protein
MLPDLCAASNTGVPLPDTEGQLVKACYGFPNNPTGFLVRTGTELELTTAT